MWTVLKKFYNTLSEEIRQVEKNVGDVQIAVGKLGKFVEEGGIGVQGGEPVDMFLGVLS